LTSILLPAQAPARPGEPDFIYNPKYRISVKSSVVRDDEETYSVDPIGVTF
jgi:hypothetical protein